MKSILLTGASVLALAVAIAIMPRVPPTMVIVTYESGRTTSQTERDFHSSWGTPLGARMVTFVHNDVALSSPRKVDRIARIDLCDQAGCRELD